MKEEINLILWHFNLLLSRINQLWRSSRNFAVAENLHTARMYHLCCDHSLVLFDEATMWKFLALLVLHVIFCRQMHHAIRPILILS